MPFDERLFQNARSSMDRSSTLDTSLSARRGDIRVLRLGLRRDDDVASLITNSRIAGHTHTEEEYISHRSFRGHAWLTGLAGFS